LLKPTFALFIVFMKGYEYMIGTNVLLLLVAFFHLC